MNSGQYRALGTSLLRLGDGVVELAYPIAVGLTLEGLTARPKLAGFAQLEKSNCPKYPVSDAVRPRTADGR